MALHHFFVQEQTLSLQSDPIFALELSDDDLHHANVLRLRTGEHIAVVDSENRYYECEVVFLDKQSLQVSIAQRVDAPFSRPHIILIQGLTKADKMTDVIRHATELGVTEFVPLIAERCVVRLDAEKGARKTQRWQSIARSAAMQSGQPRVPIVHPPCFREELFEQIEEVNALLICWEEAEGIGIKQALEDALSKQEISSDEIRIAVVVGPEGGLTAEEVEALQTSVSAPAYKVSLGPSILRTETAGIVAPALVLYELGHLQ